MEKAKKENSFLFNQGQVQFNDKLPGTTKEEKIDVKTLTKDQIEKLLLEKF